MTDSTIALIERQVEAGKKALADIPLDRNEPGAIVHAVLMAVCSVAATELAKAEAEADFHKKRNKEHFERAQSNIKEVNRLYAHIAKTSDEVADTLKKVRETDQTSTLRRRAELAERQRDEALKEVQRLRNELTDTIARTANANAKRLRAARNAMGEPE